MKNVSSKIGKGTEMTWKCGDRQSQIDHILMPTMTDFVIKYIRGNWTHSNSDHKLLTIGIKFEKLVKNKGRKKKKLR